MSSDAPEHNQKKEPPSNHLHQESTELMSSRPTRRALVPLGLDEEGQYKVMSGNSLSSIAKRALAMRGKSPDDWRAVEDEMDRIVEMNADKYPSLQSKRHFIREGWKLKIWDENVDASCEWKPWKQAEPNKFTVVGKCERVLAQDKSWLIVQPGGQAVLNPGSKAFAAPDSTIKMALPGSFVVAAGGKIHDYGSTIQTVDANSKIVKEDLTALAIDKTRNPVI